MALARPGGSGTEGLVQTALSPAAGIVFLTGDGEASFTTAAAAGVSSVEGLDD